MNEMHVGQRLAFSASSIPEYKSQRTTPMNKRNQVFYYMWAGPLFGLAIVNLILFGYWIWDGMVEARITLNFSIKELYDAVMIVGFVNFFGIFVAYLVGLIPAAITGAIAVRYERKIDEAICAALVGAAPFTSLWIAAVIMYGLDKELLPLILLAPIGAASGALCAYTRGTGTRAKVTSSGPLPT